MCFLILCEYKPYSYPIYVITNNNKFKYKFAFDLRKYKRLFAFNYENTNIDSLLALQKYEWNFTWERCCSSSGEMSRLLACRLGGVSSQGRLLFVSTACNSYQVQPSSKHLKVTKIGVVGLRIFLKFSGPFLTSRKNLQLPFWFSILACQLYFWLSYFLSYPLVFFPLFFELFSSLRFLIFFLF